VASSREASRNAFRKKHPQEKRGTGIRGSGSKKKGLDVKGRGGKEVFKGVRLP